MRRGWWLSLIVVVACNGGKTPEDEGPIDTRIDGAGADDGIDSTGTQMCMNADGQVFVVWTDDRDGTSAVWFNRSRDAGRSWMPGAVKVSHGEGEAVAPTVACTADAVYVAWEDDRDGELENHNIYFAVSTDQGDTWSEEVNIDLDDEGKNMSLGPQLAAVGDDVYVAWYDSRNGAYDIYVAGSHDGGDTFEEPTRVDSDDQGSAYSASPRIAAVSGGVVYVAWEDARDGSSDVYFSTSANGGRDWSTDVRLDIGDEPGAANSFEPKLDAEDGTIYVVWHDERNGEGRDVLMNYSDDYGETWVSGSIRVESDNVGFFDSLYPQVAVRGDTAHITWQDARSVGFDIYYRKAVGGELGAEEVRLDTDAAGFANSLFPNIAVSEAGVAVAWQDRRNDDQGLGYDDLFYNFSLDAGATWNAQDLRIDRVVPGTKYADDLNVALFREELLVAWTDGRNGTGDVFFHGLHLGEESPVVYPESE